MKKIINYILTFCFIFTAFHPRGDLGAETEIFDSKAGSLSITEQYIQTHTLDAIKNYMKMVNDQFDRQLPLIEKIIAKERESGFFGYHGCSESYRIFQDILKAVFEEALNYEIPSDFQFLRIPGDPMFDLKEGKWTFYELFDRKPPTKEIRMKIIDSLYIKPFNNEFGSSIATTDLRKKEKTQLWDLALEFIEILDSLAMEDYYSYEFEEKKSIRALNAKELESPTPYIQAIRKKIEMIKLKIDHEEGQLASRATNVNNAIAKISAIFSRVLKEKQKKVDEKKVKDLVSNNYKFSLLLNNVYSLSYDDFSVPLWNFFFPYNDHIPEQQSRIVCLNIPLFGNYYRLGECSMYVFLMGSSIAGGDDFVMELLSEFFEEIGLKKELPPQLRDIARRELKKSKNQNGSILQFFDLSESRGKSPYEGADVSSYVSHSFGIPFKSIETSQLLLNQHPIQRNDVDLQLRLIPCNHTTLNPYSFLRVIRYDSQDPKISKRIIDLMRKKLREEGINFDKLNAYKSKMDAIWHN